MGREDFLNLTRFELHDVLFWPVDKDGLPDFKRTLGFKHPLSPMQRLIEIGRRRYLPYDMAVAYAKEHLHYQGIGTQKRGEGKKRADKQPQTLKQQQSQQKPKRKSIVKPRRKTDGTT
jgi:hypothetical protein